MEVLFINWRKTNTMNCQIGFLMLYLVDTNVKIQRYETMDYPLFFIFHKPE